MGAFNSRFKPVEMFGLPLPAVGGFAVGLVFAVLALMLGLSSFAPLFVALIAGTIALVAIAFAIWCIRMGDEMAFIWVKLAAARDRAFARTSETWTKL